jgi:hypothetical protein
MKGLDGRLRDVGSLRRGWQVQDGQRFDCRVGQWFERSGLRTVFEATSRSCFRSSSSRCCASRSARISSSRMRSVAQPFLPPVQSPFSHTCAGPPRVRLWAGTCFFSRGGRVLTNAHIGRRRPRNVVVVQRCRSERLIEVPTGAFVAKLYIVVSMAVLEAVQKGPLT